MVAMLHTPGGLSPFPRTGGFLSAATHSSHIAGLHTRDPPGQHRSRGLVGTIYAGAMPAGGLTMRA
jgi:hypothetical protein